MDKNAGKNNVPLFSQILDYYSTTDKYIRSKTHSNAHQSVFTKENDKYQRLVLEQKSQCGAEARQTIKTRLAKANAQAKQPAVAEGKKHKTHIKGKGDMIRSIRTAY